MISTGFMLYN